MTNNKENIYSQGLSLVSIVFIIALIGSLIFSGITYLNKKKVLGEKMESANELTEKQNEIKSLEDQKLPTIVHAMELKKRMDSEIKWSEVIDNLNKIIPADIFFKSYEGTSNGQIFLSGESIEIKTIQELIDVFISKNYLKEVFVPNIAKGVNGNGQTNYTFNVQVNYEDVTATQNINK